MTSSKKLLVSIVAVAAALGVNAASAQSTALKASDLSQIGQWHGRAGGLVGSDRVSGLTGHTPANATVGITYDAAVQARTNMPMDRSTGSEVTVTYDQAVAERTNMPRGAGSIQAAEIARRQAN